MPEIIRHDAQVGGRSQRAGGAGVPQGVRAHALVYPRLHRQVLDCSSSASVGQLAASVSGGNGVQIRGQRWNRA
jgi:hypothetical protein